MTPHTWSIGRRAAVALATLALMALAAPAGWAVAETEGAPALSEAADEASVAAPTGEVARSAFTSEIVDREPVDQITALENDATRIYFFSELLGLDGQTVVHRWEYNGEVTAEVSFEVGGPRWRVHSSKNLDPLWLGEWSVTVVDGAGNELSLDHFSYSKAEPVPAAPAPAGAP
jgi:hypothetical protein